MDMMDRVLGGRTARERTIGRPTKRTLGGTARRARSALSALARVFVVAALLPAVAAAGAGAGASSAPVVRGCTRWAHARTPGKSGCAGVWFQVGPGADAYGGSLIRRVLGCPSRSARVCAQRADTGRVIGVYVDDTTPCPASLDRAAGTWFSADWGGWFGRPCVQYWVGHEHAHNPAHGLIYAAVGYGGSIDGRYGARFAHANATLVEWYPFAGSDFAGFPRAGAQGYILQRAYQSPSASQDATLWAWGGRHLHGVLAYY